MDEATALQLLTLSTEVSDAVRNAEGRAGALQALLQVTVRMIPGAQAASVTVGYGAGRLHTLAASSPAAEQADEIQYAAATGPCVDAVRTGSAVMVADLAEDPRWPGTGADAVRRTGLRSVLAVRMVLTADSPAGLNVYSARPSAFGNEAAVLVPVLAAHAATAVDAAAAREKSVNLERALATSRQIGMAIGILMSAHKIRSDDAFDLLRIASQLSQRKVADIAAEVVQTGVVDLPGLAERRSAPPGSRSGSPPRGPSRPAGNT